jgi:hypothetical protein
VGAAGDRPIVERERRDVVRADADVGGVNGVAVFPSDIQKELLVKIDPPVCVAVPTAPLVQPIPKYRPAVTAPPLILNVPVPPAPTITSKPALIAPALNV